MSVRLKISEECVKFVLISAVLIATGNLALAQSNRPPDEAVDLYNKATILHKEGKYQEAIETFQNSIQLKPDNAWAYNNLGAVYSDLNLFDEAVTSFNEALKLKPEFAEIHRNLGIAYIHSGKLAEAVASLKKATKLKPDYAVAFSDLGTALSNLGKNNQAIAALQHAVRLSSKDANSFNNLGCAYSRAGRARSPPAMRRVSGRCRGRSRPARPRRFRPLPGGCVPDGAQLGAMRLRIARLGAWWMAFRARWNWQRCHFAPPSTARRAARSPA